jgi:predicted nucleic acid-binding OB-fold protein
LRVFMPIIQAIIGDINDSIHVLTMLESIGKKSALTIYDPRQ